MVSISDRKPFEKKNNHIYKMEIFETTSHWFGDINSVYRFCLGKYVASNEVVEHGLHQGAHSWN